MKIKLGEGRAGRRQGGRQVVISRDQTPPTGNGESVPLWIRDGRSASEKDLLDAARAAGPARHPSHAGLVAPAAKKYDVHESYEARSRATKRRDLPFEVQLARSFGMIIHRLRLAPLVLIVAGCSGSGTSPGDGGGDAGTAPPTQQMVFMQPVGGGGPPSPARIFEVAIMNLDGSGLRQLTNDGTQKFLPHFSPDATKIVYTRFSVGGYGDPNGQSDVAIYDFATGAQTLLTHSGDAAQPTFSPDGRRVAYGRGTLTKPNGITPGLYIINVDGTGEKRIADGGMLGGDLAWSSDDWILMVVPTEVGGCFKTGLDKMRPDGSARTKVSDGGPNCTPMGMEQSGDADPGWSADGKTIYSSRGFPTAPAGGPAGTTERKLYAFSSDAWQPGKPEMDLSLASEPSCIEGVPKGSPDGARVLLYRICFDAGMPKEKSGIYVTDTAGSYRTFITDGFGPDWNPLAR